jgi:hypothetical protein
MKVKGGKRAFNQEYAVDTTCVKSEYTFFQNELWVSKRGLKDRVN